MKEYKSKFTTMMFETFLGVAATWFIYNLTGRFTHNFLFAIIAGCIVLAFFVYKIFYTDFITIILTDDNKMLIKRFNKIIKVLDINNYDWAEYSKYSNTKNAEDQDIYYVNKETGKEDYIDASNFHGDDYEKILSYLGAKNNCDTQVKVETIKK